MLSSANPDWLEIVMGYRTVDVENPTIGTDCAIDIYLPTVRTLHESLLEVRRKGKLIAGKVFTEEELEDMKEDLLSRDNLAVLDSYQERKESLERDLQIQRSDIRKQQISARLERLEEDKEIAESKWVKLQSVTKEGLLSSAQQYYCFFRSLHDHESKKPLWSSYKEFLDDSRGFFVQNLYTAYVEFTTGFDDSRLRAIAKDNFYRMIPILQGGQAISTVSTLADLSFVMVRLLYWFQYYTNVLQNSRDECPQDILDDDEKFDEWAEVQRKNLNRGDSEPQSNTSVQRHGGRQRQTVVLNG